MDDQKVHVRTITYDALAGVPIKDGEAELLASNLAQTGEDFVVATDNLIHATRAMINEGLISHDSVRFCFEGVFLHADADGRIPKWPQGFCDYLDGWLSRICRPKLPVI